MPLERLQELLHSVASSLPLLEVDRYGFEKRVLPNPKWWRLRAEAEDDLVRHSLSQNGTNESFDGKFRDECLSMEWFRNRIDATITIEQFRRQYNEIPPRPSLVNRRMPSDGLLVIFQSP